MENGAEYRFLGLLVERVPLPTGAWERVSKDVLGSEQYSMDASHPGIEIWFLTVRRTS